MHFNSDHEKTASKKGYKILRTAVILMGGVVVGLWIANTPRGLLGKADAIGFAVCHRIDARSYHLGQRTLPLCARCLGMYLGALLTLGYYFIRRPRCGSYPARSVSIVLILFFMIWAVDGLNSFFHLYPNAPHLYPPSNTLRTTTGMLVGISLATLIYPLFIQVAWRDWQSSPVLESIGELVMLICLMIPILIAVLSENPLVLYPLALFGSLAVLILLTLVYTTPMLTILHKEKQARFWTELAWPLLGGLTLAIAQIALIDWLRYRLTGTWGGFPL